MLKDLKQTRQFNGTSLFLSSIFLLVMLMKITVRRVATKKIFTSLIIGLLLFSTLFAFSGTAVHAASVYTITASADSNSTISPSGNVNVDSGNSQEFTFSANSGYYVSNVIVDNSFVSTTSPYTFTDVQSDHTISVLSASTSGGSSIAMQNTYPDDTGNYTSVDYFLYQMTSLNTNATFAVSIDGASHISMTFEGAINELVAGDSQNRTWYTWDATVTPITTLGIHTFQFFSNYWVWSVQDPVQDSYWADLNSNTPAYSFNIVESTPTSPLGGGDSLQTPSPTPLTVPSSTPTPSGLYVAQSIVPFWFWVVLGMIVAVSVAAASMVALPRKTSISAQETVEANSIFLLVLLWRTDRRLILSSGFSARQPSELQL
jgi:hypothetical protein